MYTQTFLKLNLFDPHVMISVTAVKMDWISNSKINILDVPMLGPVNFFCVLF